jgi:hypothetical protein
MLGLSFVKLGHHFGGKECWSKLKASVRATAARTREALDAALTHAFTLSTPHDARGWFAHCRYL